MVTLDDRFWSKVDKGTGYGCWEWLASGTPGGYGQYSFKGRSYYAHRLTWADKAGDPPTKGMHVDHTCANSSCVNPDHLELVTPEENQRRRRIAVKGRWPGISGSYWLDDIGMWSAVIVHRGVLYDCGNFSSKSRAETAINRMKRVKGLV